MWFCTLSPTSGSLVGYFVSEGGLLCYTLKKLHKTTPLQMFNAPNMDLKYLNKSLQLPYIFLHSSFIIILSYHIPRCITLGTASSQNEQTNKNLLILRVSNRTLLCATLRRRLHLHYSCPWKSASCNDTSETRKVSERHDRAVGARRGRREGGTTNGEEKRYLRTR